jgi:hypothetical protein
MQCRERILDELPPRQRRRATSRTDWLVVQLWDALP